MRPMKGVRRASYMYIRYSATDPPTGHVDDPFHDPTPSMAALDTVTSSFVPQRVSRAPFSTLDDCVCACVCRIR